MLLDNVIGQRGAKSLLNGEHMPGGILLCGQKAIGKYSLACNFIQEMLCVEGLACGKCGPCAKMLQGAHPDVHMLNPVEGVVGIDAVREMRQRWSYARSESDYKFALIRRADLMTPSASQALLKLLEDPGDKCCVLMTARDLTRMPMTIRSRAQIVKCGPLSDEEIVKVAAKRGVKIAAYAGQVWGGSFLPDEWIDEFVILSGVWSAHSPLPDSVNADQLRRELLFLGRVLSYMLVSETDCWREIRLRRPRVGSLPQSVWVIEQSLNLLAEKVSLWLVAKRTVSQLRTLLS